MSRRIDTSRAICDTCQKPYVDGEALYSVATKINDDGVMTSFRHAKCHVPIETHIEQLKNAFNKLRREL